MRDSKFNYEYYGEYSTYIASLGEDNSDTHNTLIKNLRRALCEDITDRQRQMIQMHYVDKMKICEIARILGVNSSTVSRTISRGEARLQKCLRYGARELLSRATDVHRQ